MLSTGKSNNIHTSGHGGQQTKIDASFDKNLSILCQSMR